MNKTHKTNKGRVIIANSAQQILNFTSKPINHIITILNIHNDVPKKRKEKKKEKRGELEQSYQVKYCMHLSYASLRWRKEVLRSINQPQITKLYLVLISTRARGNL